MSTPDATGRFVIENALGLHARAATKLVQLASRFPCEVEIARAEQVGKRLRRCQVVGFQD